VGDFSEIFLRRLILIAGLLIVFEWCLATDAGYAVTAPRAAVFILNDSVSVALDFADLLDERNRAMLDDGYPLSFELSVSLFEPGNIWFDSRVAQRKGRFCIEYRRWDEKYALRLVDFYGDSHSGFYESLGEILVDLDERLTASLAGYSDLDPVIAYYVRVRIEHSTLTFDDMKSSEDWLEHGNAAASDSAESRNESLGDRAARFLWGLAGVKTEEESFETRKFRTGDLRRER